MISHRLLRAAASFILTTADERTTHSQPFAGHGFTYEIDEVHRCLRAGDEGVRRWFRSTTRSRSCGRWTTIRAQIGSVLPGD